MNKEITGVLLMTMGDPPDIGGIFPFLFRLFSDKSIIPAPAPVRYPLALYISLKKLSAVASRYRLIGGGSPMNKMTFMQAALLEKKLNEDGRNFKVYIANRYNSPLTKEAYRLIKADGIKKLVALPLYPHYSNAVTGSSFKELQKELKKDPAPPKVVWIKSIGADERYARAFSEKVGEALREFGEAERKDVQFLFSAHSLPHDFIKKGDPYLNEIRDALTPVLKILKPAHFSLCFQSKGRKDIEWLTPETDEVMRELARKGADKVLLVPISFVAENIETLYDCDILFRGLAAELGIKKFVRAKTPGEDQEFIEALAGIVLDRLK